MAKAKANLFVRRPCAVAKKRTSKELQEACAQLQEAEEIIQSSRTKDKDQVRQIAELQDALLEQEQLITERFEGEVADLKQKLTE